MVRRGRPYYGYRDTGIYSCYRGIDIFLLLQYRYLARESAVTIFLRFSFYTTLMTVSRFCFRDSAFSLNNITIETRFPLHMHGVMGPIWILSVQSLARSHFRLAIISHRAIFRQTLFRLSTTTRNFRVSAHLSSLSAAFPIYGRVFYRAR